MARAKKVCHNGAMPYIELSGKNGINKQVIVDEEDYEKYSIFKWWYKQGYAIGRLNASKNGRMYRMHRLILDAPESLVVDHLNGNKLDNRKKNLRACTQKDNANNRHGVKGYNYDKMYKKYRVRYKGEWYGRYDTEEEAKRAYQLAKSGVPYQKRERRQMYHLPTGVFKNRSNKGYQARISINGERVYLGTFTTIKEAEKAYLERKRG